MKKISVKSLSIIFIIYLLINNFSGFSQIPVNTWRSHFSNNEIVSLADAGEYIYAANELSIFSYNKETGEIQKIDKTNYLTDAGISTINFNKKTNSLVIAYNNSNINILRNDTIYNFSEIKRKQINGNKQINSITFKGDTAYLACGFGIVLFNTKKLEFSDTYFIGENAEMINIYETACNDENLFAATEKGVFYINFDSNNPADYRNWTKLTEMPNSDFKCNEIETNGTTVYISQIQDETGKTVVYKYQNSIFTVFDTDFVKLIDLHKSNNFIIFSNEERLRVYDTDENVIHNQSWYNFEDSSTWMKINKVVIDEKKDIWIADQRFGLVLKKYQSKLFSILPNGPSTNRIARIHFAGKTITATSGSGTGQTWFRPEYYSFQNNEWSTHLLANTNAYEFFSINSKPGNSENIFIGSWGTGIYEFNNNVLVNYYNEKNSSLQAVAGFVSINSMAFDNNSNMWLTNWYVPYPISVMTKEKKWYAYNFNGILSNKVVENITVTKDNTKWLQIRNAGGMFAFNDNNTPDNKADDYYKSFVPIASDGEIISQNIYSMAEDLDGALWIGTDNGVAVYYNPSEVFEDKAFIAERIQLTSYGRDTTEQYLLTTDIVTKIIVDGANRKWLGTKSSGLFLISDNGKSEIHNFNKDNSPLVSNTIHDLALDPKTGEIFIATEGGLLSFRSDATSAQEYFEDVYVFPNPVRPEYTGDIIITGLARDVNVKITDISGNIVYETTALGGQAVWNGNTFDNRRVNTGVYLIFCSNKDGSKTFVTKLLFIN